MTKAAFLAHRAKLDFEKTHGITKVPAAYADGCAPVFKTRQHKRRLIGRASAEGRK